MFILKNKKYLIGTIIGISFIILAISCERHVSPIELTCYILSGVITVTFTYAYKKSNSITILISTITFFFLTIVQPLWSFFFKEEVSLSGHLAIEDLLSTQYRVSHIIYLFLFFSIFIYAVAFISIWRTRINLGHFRVKEGMVKKLFLRIDPVVIAVIYSILGALYLYETNLFKPGSPPRVAHSGIFVYAFKIVTLFCWGICISGTKDSSKKIIRMVRNLLMAILFSFPQMIMGSRSVLFFFIGQLIIIELLIAKSRNNGDISFSKKDVAILSPVIIFAMTILIISIRIGNSYRENAPDILPRQFLFNRITGIVDGIITSKYTYTNSYNRLPISNLFLLWLFPGKGTNMSLFYSVNLRGQKVSDPNAWARPAYASGLLYAGVFGVIFLALVAAVVLSALELLIKKSLLQDNVFAAAAFGYSYVYIFFTFILEGDADIMFTFLWISVAVIILDAFISIRIKKKE